MEWVTQKPTCNIGNIDETQKKLILGRKQFYYPRVGCCGQIRNDEIFPIGYTCEFNNFKKEAIEVVELFENDNNVYSIEYFQGVSLSDFRGNGLSLYLLTYRNNKWEFYMDGNFKFSKSKEEIIDEWGKQV